MKKIKIYVTLRESILDPAGTAVKGSLNNLGFSQVTDVRIGKYIELMVDETESNSENLHEKVTEMCKKLLANVVMEDYRIEIAENSTKSD